MLVFLHRALEILDRVAQALAQISQLAGPEEDQRNGQDEQQFGYPKFSAKQTLCESHSPEHFLLRAEALHLGASG